MSLFCRLRLVSTFVDFRLVSHASEMLGLSGASTNTDRVSEPRDVVSDLGFVEKRSFLHWDRLASGDLPLKQDGTDGRTTVLILV